MRNVWESAEERRRVVAATLSDEVLLNSCFKAAVDFNEKRSELLPLQRERAIRLMRQRIESAGNECSDEDATAQVEALMECFTSPLVDPVAVMGRVLQYLVEAPTFSEGS